MKKLILLFSILFCCFGISRAQINELGLFAGGSNFIGDIGGTNYIYPNSMAYGVVYKWNAHPRYSLRANYIYSKIEGDDADSGNSYREFRGWNFSSPTHEISAGIEFNFFKYNLSRLGYRQTPYINVGVSAAFSSVTSNQTIADPFGGTIPNTITGNIITYSVPVGIGYKFPLWNNIGMGIETSFRYTFRDDMDGYPFESTDNDGNTVTVGNSNGNDWYVFTGITIVYAFGREGCYTGNF